MAAILNEDEQKILLEYVFSERNLYLHVLSVCKPEYFEEPLDRAVAFVNEYFNEYHAIPEFDLIRVKTGVAFTKREVHPSEYNYATVEFEKHAKLAAVKLAFHASIEDFEKGEIDGIMKKMGNALSVAIKKELGINQFENVAERLEKMRQSIDSRSIGLHKLDVMLDNIRRAELVMFVAGTAAGKSITLANIANNLARDGLHVLILSLELTKELIAKRLDSVISGMENKAIFDNIEDVVLSLDAVKDRYGSITTDKIPNGSNAQYIRNYIIQYHLINGYYPDVLVVDYLDLMKPIDYNGREGTFDRDKASTEELRDVIVEFNMYGFTASQMNRDSVGVEVVTHAHIAGGISKLNTVDAAVAILAPTEQEEDTGERTFQQMKVRNGERHTKPMTLYLNPKNLRLTENPTTATGSPGIGPGILKRGKQGNKDGVKGGLSSVKLTK